MSTQSATETTKGQVVLVAMESGNIDTTCYRGSAPLSALSAISQADVFDQVANPGGLQRDLSPKHASDAYNYANREPNPEFPRAFPEVMLNVRDEDVVSVEAINTGRQRQIKVIKFAFDLSAIDDAIKEGRIAVSRMDGNHRLWFGNGDDKNRAPVDTVVPFQIHVGLTPEQEANLFTDVNANQKGLNSSHLHVLRSRLTPEEQELRDHPERVFALRLSEDTESPWHDLVHMGGSKQGSRAAGQERPVSFVTLEQGIKRMLNKSVYIHDLPNPNAQYVLIRNFWNAVRAEFEDQWQNHKEFLLLKNLGVLSLSIFGGTVIDRSMARGEVTAEAMRGYITQAKDVFDWHKDAKGERSLVGMSGNRAALIVSGELAKDLVDPGESAIVQSLQERLLAEAGTIPDEMPAEWERRPDVADLVAAGVRASVGGLEDDGQEPDQS
jgi:DGQHR domain-containing protein